MDTQPILRIKDLSDLPNSLQGGSVAIGNFDGVHRGHQAVLQEALDRRVSDDAPAIALTFEPHPRTVFRPENPVFRLTPAPLKAQLIGALGFAAIVELQFDREFAKNSAADFVDDILVGSLKTRHIVTGFNFHFGRDRQGSPDFLREVSGQYGFDVSEVAPFTDEGNEPISSSRIRTCLAQGDVSQAAGLLGYRYTVEAPIVRGKQLGRTLGYPTANMQVEPNSQLRPGIYAVRFKSQDGKTFDGVASFGRRPTVDEDGPLLLETYVFDFEGDLYGQLCSVSFVAHLRDELKFDGLDPLVAQMKRDEEEARAALSNVQPLGPLDRTLTAG